MDKPTSIFKQIDDTFSWETDSLSLSFSEPHIQGFDDFTQLRSAQDILYFYYTVRIFKKTSSFDEDDNETIHYDLLCERQTHDFPMITQLISMLQSITSEDIRETGQKNLYANGAIRFSKTLSTEGFGCDDFYEITKSVDELGEKEMFTFYCGTSYEPQSDLNSAGIRTPYLFIEDIESLLKCADSFVNYALKEHNTYNLLHASSYAVKDNRIYCYGLLDKAVDYENVNSIIAVWDIVSIISVIDNIQKRHNNVAIETIVGDKVHLSDGYVLNNADIFHVWKQASEKELHFNKEQIVEDFLSVLTEKEIFEFKNEQVDHLLSKYKSAIINRTWMCRSEHQFDIDYETGNTLKEVVPVVDDVVRSIKAKLNSN